MAVMRLADGAYGLAVSILLTIAVPSPAWTTGSPGVTEESGTLEPPPEESPPVGIEAEEAPGAGRVKEIRLYGLKATRPYIVFRELEIDLGEPVTPESLEADRRRLDRLDLFSDIEVRAVEEADGVVVEYDLRENSPWLPSVSVQITDENGVSAGGGVRYSNFLGRDISGRVRVLAGGATTVETLLRNPWVAGNHLAYQAGYRHLERHNSLVDFFETVDGLEVGMDSWIGTRGRVGAKLGYLELRSDQDGKTLSPDNRDKVFEVALFAGLDTRDVLSATNTGWWNEIEIRHSRQLETSTGFWQLTVDVRRYLRLGRRQTITLFPIARLRSGTPGVDIAPWQMFYLGGTNSVRGWSLASREGKNEAIVTSEYRYRLLEPRGWNLPFGIRYRGGIDLAAFVDVGIVWDESDQFAWRNSIAGGGIGLRALVPFIGVMRFDVAMGESGGKVMVHIGGFEKPVRTRNRVR